MLAGKSGALSNTCCFMLGTCIAFLVGLEPSIVMANIFRSFVKFECNPDAGTFEIRELTGLDEEGEALGHEGDTIDLADLLIPAGTTDDEALIPGKILERECKLGRETFLAKVSASKGIIASGICGAAPPSVVLSLGTKKRSSFFIKDLEFNRSCYDEYIGNVSAVKVLGAKRQLRISVGSQGVKFEKKYPLDVGKWISREDIVRVSISLAEEHKRALERFKETGSVNDAIGILEAASMRNALERRPADLNSSVYVNIVNDYAFFLSQTPHRYQEAIPILEKVIRLSPKRNVAYLNLGDTYAKVLEHATDPKNMKELKSFVAQNYQQYARLVEANNQSGELPQRVRDVLLRNEAE